MAALRPALITEWGTPADLDDSTAYTLCMNNACGRDRNPGAHSALSLFSPHSYRMESVTVSRYGVNNTPTSCCGVRSRGIAHRPSSL